VEWKTDEFSQGKEYEAAKCSLVWATWVHTAHVVLWGVAVSLLINVVFIPEALYWFS
jgi:hypothetical protein